MDAEPRLDHEVLLLRVSTAPLDPDLNTEHEWMTLATARGLIDSFVRAGHRIDVINGGVRIHFSGHHLDFVHRDALRHEWRYAGKVQNEGGPI